MDGLDYRAIQLGQRRKLAEADCYSQTGTTRVLHKDVSLKVSTHFAAVTSPLHN
jgi:hypothetical protein